MVLSIDVMRCVYIVMILFLLFMVGGAYSCPYKNFSSHKLQVYETYSYSLINSTTPGVFINQSKYGVEGGQIVLINNTFYLFITEFTGDPLFVPSNLSLWSITKQDFLNNKVKWKHRANLFTSGGTCDCNSTRASLGSSISVAYNDTSHKWLMFYVGFQSCDNDTFFVNRNGRIYLAESINENNIIGPYKDVNVILSHDNQSQLWWEGKIGISSFSNPWKINNTYYAFYGSGLNNQTTTTVGLISSNNSLYGPWIRSPNNPIWLINNPQGYTEQPIVFKFKDNSYGAFFDSLHNEGKGVVGYNWSPDGINWDENCYQLLTVLPQNGTHWGSGGRTPQGLIPINDTHFYLFFSGYTPQQGQRYESFGYAKVSFVV